MARRSAAQPLTVRVDLRCTAEEGAKLAELSRASGRTRSDIVRSLIRGQTALRAMPAPRPIADDKALRAIGRIGHNVNQMARELHRRDRQGVSADEFAALNRALLQVVALMLSGADAARMLFSHGLVAFMAQVPDQRVPGPREPHEAPPQGQG